jgi:crotonobetainyl-CoA:carnitine CoA-transferase CaiB-like acyl-CoA transferase
MLQRCEVVDVTDRLAWLAGRRLGDLGADVVKVEAPDANVDGAEWRALNVNKRLVRLDVTTGTGVVQFDQLVAAADIVLCTPHPGTPGTLDPRRIAERHPKAVIVSVTPFGLKGPKANWLASDLELMAAGGAMSLAGESDGAPMRVSAPQAYAWAGGQAAVGALVALHHQRRTGRGQLVDVSAQSAVITALSHAPAFVDLLGTTPTRAGAYMTGRSVTGAQFRVFWPCRDGYLNFILYGGAAGRRTNEQLVAWMREADCELGPLAGIDWSRWDPTRATQAEVDAIEAPIGRFFATIGKRDFLEETHRREMLGYPVSTVADIAADPQLEARGFWQDLRGPDGRMERHCGSFVVVDGVRRPLAAADSGAAPIARRA